MKTSLKSSIKPFLAPVLRIKHFRRIGKFYVLRDAPEFINLYYEYCKKLIMSATKNKSYQEKIYLVTVDYVEILPPDAHYVLIQYEHVIVAKEYQIRPNEVEGDFIDRKESNKFKVRLLGNLKTYHKSLAIIEYSMTNIEAIKKSTLFNIYQEKVFYVAPTFLEPSQKWTPIDQNPFFATMFGNPEIGRRKIFLEKSSEAGVDIFNLMGNYKQIEKLLHDVAVLVNIHQTSMHKTLEELRILPTLAIGTRVLSEESPFLNVVPYRKFIQVCDQDHIVKMLKCLDGKDHESILGKMNRIEFLMVYREMQEQNTAQIGKLLENYTREASNE